MPAVQHVEPVVPRMTGSEVEVMCSMLEYCRSVMMLKCQNLSDDELKRHASAPSQLSLLGLVRHLSKVEHYWFQQCFLGRDEGFLYSSPEHPQADFEDLESHDVNEVIQRYADVCGESQRVARNHSLDELAARQRHGNDVSLRYIVVHMIEEYARHLGHADLLREAIDGSTGG